MVSRTKPSHTVGEQRPKSASDEGNSALLWNKSGFHQRGFHYFMGQKWESHAKPRMTKMLELANCQQPGISKLYKAGFE